MYVHVRIVRPESFRSNVQRSNTFKRKYLQVANASADLRSFNRVCVHLRVRAIANVCNSTFGELVCDHIHARATSLILPCGTLVA